MEIKRIKYGEGRNDDFWYKFGVNDGAVHIDDNTIENWVNQVINNVKSQLEEGVESPYSFVSSGDTIVFGFFSQDDQEDVFSDDNYFVVIVAKNYEEGSFFISDIKKENTSLNDRTLEELLKNLGDYEKFITKDYEIEIKRRKEE